MRKLTMALMIILMLTLVGCAGKGTYLSMDLPRPDGTVAHIEASGDTIVEYDVEKNTYTFTTEQVKTEQFNAMVTFLQSVLASLGAK